MIKLIEKSKLIASAIDNAIHGARISSDDRYVVAGGCFDVVLEHQKSVTILGEARFLGSAFALVRAIFEAYVRGLWIRYCATDDEIVVLQQQDKINKNKNIAQMIASIEKVPGFDVGMLSAINCTSYSSMCSYTHTGWLQIGRRFNGEYIESNYSDSEVEEVLNFANTIALLAAHEIAKMTKDKKVVVKVRTLFMESTE